MAQLGELAEESLSRVGSEPASEGVSETTALALFRERYELLRQAYERRVRDLGQGLQDTCARLLRSEVVDELARDPASSAFIPGHIAEVVSAHLLAERETSIHESLDRVSELELALRQTEETLRRSQSRAGELEAGLVESQRALQALQPLGERLWRLEAEYRGLETSAAESMEALEADKSALEERLQSVSDELAFKVAECELLGVSSGSRVSLDGLAAAGTEDRSRLRSLLTDVVAELRALRAENGRLSEERRQLLKSAAGLEEETRGWRDRGRRLLAESQRAVAEEQAHSAELIRAVLHKAQAAKTSLVLEVEELRRQLLARDRELVLERGVREDQARELRAVQSQVDREREQLSAETRKGDAAQRRLSELEKSLVGKERELGALELQLERARAERMALEEQYAQFKRNVIEERRLMKGVRESEARRSEMESRLQFQNMLRHSFTFGDASIEETVTAMRGRQQARGRRPEDAPSNGSVGRPSYRELEDELRAMRSDYSELKARTLREQTTSSNALTALRSKFDQLLQSHEQNLHTIDGLARRATAEESRRKGFEQIALGILRSLTALGLIENTLARQLMGLAESGDTKSDSVYELVGDVLNKFVVELNSAHSEIENLRKERRRIAQLESALKHAEEDKERVRELCSREAEKELKALRGQLKELSKQHHDVDERVKTEAAMREQSLRQRFEDEFNALRKGYEAKVATLTANLRSEHRRRKEAQQLVAAKEETMQRLFAEHDRKISKFQDKIIDSLD